MSIFKATFHLMPYRFKKKCRLLYLFILRISKYGYKYRGNTKNVTYLNDGSNSTFFGYHDKTPFSADGSKILAMSIGADDREPNSECSPMKIGYFKKNEGGSFENFFIPFSKTTTWCFQQGCMLQWHPNYLNKRVLFNRLVDSKYGSVVFDIEKNMIIKEYTTPIYSLSPTGSFATSVNFSRLGRLRPGYGYDLLPDKTINEHAPENDGLFLLDLSSEKKKLLISLNELANDVKALDSDHYVNHATFSPDGKKISFFHLWLTKSKKRKLRLCVYDIENNNWFVLEDTRSVSHYAWKNNEEILVTTKELTGSNTRRISLFNIRTKHRKDIFTLKRGDTHPMRSPIDENLFIMDSYPDKFRDQHLYLFNLKKKEFECIGSFYSPMTFNGQVRCDLHPRWDRTGTQVVIDTAKEGRRKMALIKI